MPLDWPTKSVEDIVVVRSTTVDWKCHDTSIVMRRSIAKKDDWRFLHNTLRHEPSRSLSSVFRQLVTSQDYLSVIECFFRASSKGLTCYERDCFGLSRLPILLELTITCLLPQYRIPRPPQQEGFCMIHGWFGHDGRMGAFSKKKKAGVA